jgi:hypothetical protein
MEEPLGGLVMAHAPIGEVAQDRRSADFGNLVHAGAPKLEIGRTIFAHCAEVANEQDHGGIGFGVFAGVAAILDRGSDRVEGGADGDQRAGVERLLVAHGDVVSHGMALRS